MQSDLNQYTAEVSKIYQTGNATNRLRNGSKTAKDGHWGMGILCIISG
ncbi:MAG: hypothetical protein LBR10_01315 [Prevotellaceae bacterium]|nr:hypothetical protein [Prevotellaceae bacterium]